MHNARINTAPALLLVDASSYLYRAFHALPDLRADPSDPSSQPTGAVRGMLNMLGALRKQFADVPHGACVFDAHGPTFRHGLYADYKATRKPMPDELRSQIAPVHELVRLLGWPLLAVPGVEADDVLATLAHAAAAQGLDVVISSGDKDLAQLVTPHITIMDTMSGKLRDEAGVQEEFGVPPALMLDWQTLVGDAVDNIPGVEKVGPKTATKWLAEYGSLQALVEHAGNIKGAAGERLRAALDWLPKARELLKIRNDVQGLPALSELALQPENKEGLAAFYQQYGFRGAAKKAAAKRAPKPAAPPADLFDAADEAAPPAPLLDALLAERPAAADALPKEPPESGEPRYCSIQDWETFDAWMQKISAAPLVAIDTETDSLDAMRARIVGLSVSVAPFETAYIPLGHVDDFGVLLDGQLPAEQVLQRLAPWLADPEKAKLGQNFKYDRHVFANCGLKTAGFVHDTMLQSYVLEAHLPHSLQSLAERHLGRSGTSYEDLCGRGAQQKPFASIAIEDAAHYACEDAEQTLAVHQALWPQIAESENLRRIYALEIATAGVLFDMERLGVLIDTAALQQHSAELGTRMNELQLQAWQLAGQQFNLGSPKQIGEIFFDKLGLPVTKKTSTGRPSTDEEVLETLAADFPLPARILEHRALAKLKSTYTDKLPHMQDASARIHTNYAQAVAVTGRLASNEPNLQNIPVRTPEGRRIRAAFIAPPGSRIVSCDYSQIELRIMAHLSEDEALLRAFEQGQDIHRATAAEIFGAAPENVSPEQRRAAKAINFGLIYGMGSFGLARSLGIEKRAAANYIERYFERYPGVHRYMERCRAAAREHGCVHTIFGRRLAVPEIHSANAARRAGAERAAINAPMQGSAADLIKLAMIAVHRALAAERLHSAILMQVHDELVLQVPDAELPWVRANIPQLMASVATLRVPLLAELGEGANWAQAH
ncbi:MAG: DNA polymerase I [Ottowia sp.]|nr:DNA polymerase I [Ottowia sp.]